MHKSIFILASFLCCSLDLQAQNIDEPPFVASLVFWTAQEWKCEQIKITVYKADSTLYRENYLITKLRLDHIPECGEQGSLTIEQIEPGSYFFVADCSRELCSLCNGEGSYWQSIVHDQTSSGARGGKSKGDINGTWKTCHQCQGDGKAYRMMWVDTLTLFSNQCRSVLLQ